MNKTQKITTQMSETERYESPAICDIEPVTVVTGEGGESVDGDKEGL